LVVPEKLKRETEMLMTSKVMPDFSRGKQADCWRICWDGQTPTEDRLLCKYPHPQLSNLYLVMGGRFHSYKFINPECESIL
jgi:sarcosine oxidase / L-pipecolate oxidase